MLGMGASMMKREVDCPAELEGCEDQESKGK